MPRKDGTGPMSSGAMSGRGLGPCAGANVVGYDAGFSRGCIDRRGMGLGNGCKRSSGRNFAGQYLGMTQRETLSEHKEFLQRDLRGLINNYKISQIPISNRENSLLLILLVMRCKNAKTKKMEKSLLFAREKSVRSAK